MTLHAVPRLEHEMVVPSGGYCEEYPLPQTHAFCLLSRGSSASDRSAPVEVSE